MLTSLYIKNFALIDELDVDFNNGLTIITGETGAGKSILLGGLSLVLGKRADLSQIKNKDEKCVIEAVFDVAKYDLKPFFKELDLDYDVQTIVRREILPSGKSRAFINDTPVTLGNLMVLSEYLIDIHSQHQTQQLAEDAYQFKVIDALANNKSNLIAYSELLLDHKKFTKELEILNTSKSEMIKEYDYNLFLLNELKEIHIESVDLEALESQYEALNNVEEIEERLGNSRAIINAEDLGVIDQLNAIKQELTKIAGYGKTYDSLLERVVSLGIEIDDIILELDSLHDNISTDPEALEHINSQLQILNNLLHKHTVSNVEELIQIKEILQAKVNNTENLDDSIIAKTKEIEEVKAQLDMLATKIHKNRSLAIPKLTTKLESILFQLGMPNARFKIELALKNHFYSNGKDEIQFLFTANKGSDYKPLRKSASGGEMSRIMLAIKSILAEYIQLPYIMFDEIDTGVSGEISNKMGEIMREMSKTMQVFAITHLPQIAAKGDVHFKVFKKDKANKTHTNLKRLNEEDRVVEIAQMLGGINVSESAIAHAKQLLN